MAFTKVQLLSLLASMPDNTEIVVPSYRNPANQITQIARVEACTNPAGEPCLVLVPASVLPFRPEPSKEASDDSTQGPEFPTAA
jgi:hypothetical protein